MIFVGTELVVHGTKHCVRLGEYSPTFCILALSVSEPAWFETVPEECKYKSSAKKLHKYRTLMNFSRIYDYRFQNINHSKKKIVWDELSKWLFEKHLNCPTKILDPAGGMCEFINSVPSKEKWAIDIEEAFIKKYANDDVKIIIGSNLDVSIPKNHFDGIFISNFLEHLKSQDEVSQLLTRMFDSMAPKGRIVIMGPNFKYCYDEYFDFADHNVILSELGVAEHLYGAGFDIVKIIPKFFPLSFRSGGFLPVTPLTIKTYLNVPMAWKYIGKQFLVIGEKK